MDDKENVFQRYPKLEGMQIEFTQAVTCLTECFRHGGKLLLCGNGGSSSDCEHICGELMKGFIEKRPLSDAEKKSMRKASPDISEETLDKLQGAFPSICLSSMMALNSAYANDVDPTLTYAQGVWGLGKIGDVLLAISTSGNSQNVVQAAQVAKGKGMQVIALTGKTGGKLRMISDICLCAPETDTYLVQELHLPIYHALCIEVEKTFFK